MLHAKAGLKQTSRFLLIPNAFPSLPISSCTLNLCPVNMHWRFKKQTTKQIYLLGINRKVPKWPALMGNTQSLE